VRVLFTPLAWPSHLFPMVPLAWACRAAGHEVQVAAQPPVIDAITGAGLTAVSVGESYDLNDAIANLHQQAQEAGWTRSIDEVRAMSADERRRFIALRSLPHVKAAEAMADDLVAFVRWWRPDLIVTDPVVLAAPLAAGVAGIPLVRHLWGLDLTRRAAFPRGGDTRDQWPEELFLLFDRYDVHLRADFADFGVRTVDPCPASIQFPGVPHRLPVRHVPYNGTGITPPWLAQPARRRRVCVTWGTSTTRLIGAAGFLVPGILTALASLDADVVIAVKKADRGLLGALPDGMRVTEDLPLSLLLPACDAIIHQGGFGTMIAAARYGLPQVILAVLTDQATNAERLASTGAGIYLPPGQAGPDAIKTAMSAILSDDAPREAARHIREEILAQPAPAAIVATLEELC